MSASAARPKSAAGRFIDELEESLIALILGAMTLITFVNVVVRYGFNGNILWALEVTVYLFAWLVLLGASYAVKKNAHLGIDLLANALSPGPRRIMTTIAAACCVIYALILLRGAWDYWAPFAEMPPLEGRLIPTGVQERFLGKGWYETQSTPIPDFMRFLEGWINQGEAYEKMPRAIPYFIMPLSMALLTLRVAQAFWRVAAGRQQLIIASHEAEDAIEEAAERADATGAGRKPQES